MTGMIKPARPSRTPSLYYLLQPGLRDLYFNPEIPSLQWSLKKGKTQISPVSEFVFWFL